MNILYLDPVLGISGDMTISALIDAGCPLSVLTDLLGRLPVSVPSMSTEEKRHGAIAGRRLIIGPSDIRLSVTQMRQMIERLDAEERVKADAAAILDIIVNAESKVHGVPKEDIHFHELSHIDTIIDVLCAARAIAYFKIDKVFCGPVPVGRGFVKTAHGIMPNPPPATTEPPFRLQGGLSRRRARADHADRGGHRQALREKPDRAGLQDRTPRLRVRRLRDGEAERAARLHRRDGRARLR